MPFIYDENSGTWRHTFDLNFPLHSAIDAAVMVTRDPEWGLLDPDGNAHALPSGCAAIVDSENAVIAFIPDVVGLVNPDRMLPELIAALLNKVC